MSFMARRLERIESDLEDLIDFSERVLLKCVVCGAYHASDINGQDNVLKMREMLEKVREWKLDEVCTNDLTNRGLTKPFA